MRLHPACFSFRMSGEALCRKAHRLVEKSLPTFFRNLHEDLVGTLVNDLRALVNSPRWFIDATLRLEDLEEPSKLRKRSFENMNSIIFKLLFSVAVVAASPLSATMEDQSLSVSLFDHSHISPSIYPSSIDVLTPQRPERVLQRAPPNPGPVLTTSAFGWIIKYRNYYSVLIPVQVAASVLEEFYTDCLRRIDGKMALNIPGPGNAFTFSVGSVFLAFRVADPTKGLEWSGCQKIIDALLKNARRGFVGQFRSEWWHPDTGSFLYVSMSMLQRIGPGRVGND